MIQLVLFDIDGTLIRTGGAGVKAFAKVFEAEFGVLDGFDRLKFAGRTDYSLVREFFSFHEIDPCPGNFTRFFDRYAFWLDHILHEARVEVCRGVREFIDISQNHHDAPLLGLLTGNVRLGAELKLRKAGLWDCFRTGAFADDHEERDHIAAIARQRGESLLGRSLRGEEVVVIGDTPLDIRCAKAIGARILSVATGGASLEENRKHRPDWAVNDLSEISVPNILGRN